MNDTRRIGAAVIGLVSGVAALLIASWAAGVDGTDLPYTLIIVLAIALSGLALGAAAAAAAFVAGAGGLALLEVTRLPDLSLGSSDYLRLGTFVIGSAAIVYLTWRAETARATAEGALAASRQAAEEAHRERAQLERTREELDEALAVAERDRARLEEVAESIPEPLIVYDEAACGTYGNRAAMRLFGRSFVERALDEWGRVAEPRDEHGRTLERDEWPQLVAQSEPFRSRLILRVPMSGRDMIVDVEGTPIPGGGAVLLLRDVGKEEDARRRLSRFASFVAHELRNPMAVAKARIELALRDAGLPERPATHGRRALESVDAAIGILERLELYSRADSGSIEALHEPFELAPALGSAIERLRAGGSEREVLVTLATGVRVIGDRQLSEQAITNLLVNAHRYSSPGTPIHVEVDAADVVALRVRDEGPGIADDVADRLFRDRVTAGRGLGLGLYLVSASMKAMVGSVALERRRPGAVFALRWPAATER